MNSFDGLGKRIDGLLQILGPLPDEPQENPNNVGGAPTPAASNNTEDLTDALFSANTLISSAMTGRDKIADVVMRSDELESYLDPGHLDAKQDVKAKVVYVNTVAPELAANFESLERIKQMEATLGAEYFRNMPDVADKLKDMHASALETQQQIDMLQYKLIQTIQRKGDILNGINDELRRMDERLDNILVRLAAQRDQEREE